MVGKALFFHSKLKSSIANFPGDFELDIINAFVVPKLCSLHAPTLLEELCTR